MTRTIDMPLSWRLTKTVGLTQEDFYITKGNYFADLEKYYSAINCYEKALKKSEMNCQRKV